MSHKGKLQQQPTADWELIIFSHSELSLAGTWILCFSLHKYRHFNNKLVHGNSIEFRKVLYAQNIQNVTPWSWHIHKRRKTIKAFQTQQWRSQHYIIGWLCGSQTHFECHTSEHLINAPQIETTFVLWRKKLCFTFQLDCCFPYTMQLVCTVTKTHSVCGLYHILSSTLCLCWCIVQRFCTDNLCFTK